MHIYDNLYYESNLKISSVVPRMTENRLHMVYHTTWRKKYSKIRAGNLPALLTDT